MADTTIPPMPQPPSVFKQEIQRNASGYFLIIAGLVALGCANFIPDGSGAQTAMLDAGKGIIGAALIAFQIKRTPEGNTTTVQTTTPIPTYPPAPLTPVVTLTEPAPAHTV